MKRILITLSLFLLNTIQGSWYIDWAEDIGHKTHGGWEFNAAWNLGDSKMQNYGTDYILEGQNRDFSIQYTLYKKWMLRYTYIKLYNDFKGPAGVDQSYNYQNSYGGYVSYEHYASSRLKKSHIFSIGYPIKLFNYDMPYYRGRKTYELPIIILLGISINNSEVMDLYEHWEGGYTVLNSEWNYYIENRKNDVLSINLSYGISIPFFVQTSIIFTGNDWRLMFGMGL